MVDLIAPLTPPAPCLDRATLVDRRAALIQQLAALKLEHDTLEEHVKRLARELDQLAGAIDLADELIAQLA